MVVTVTVTYRFNFSLEGRDDSESNVCGKQKSHPFDGCDDVVMDRKLFRRSQRDKTPYGTRRDGSVYPPSEGFNLECLLSVPYDWVFY